ncbi:MAG: Ig domain-containing protein, partial [Lachnospiraceae bacterium]
YKDTMHELNESNDLLSIIIEKLGVTGEELLFNFRAALFLKNAQGVYGFHGEEWAESIKSKYVTVADENTSVSLQPGAAVVVPLKNTYVPSGAGDNIRFAGMYPDKTEDDITVSVTGDTAITKPGGTIQLSATVLPLAVSQSVIYSVPDEAQKELADVTLSGLVTAKKDGTITVRATSVYKPSKYDDITITISGQNAIKMNRTEEEVTGGIKITYTAETPNNAEIYYTTDGTEPTVTSTRMTTDGVLFDTVGTHTLKVLGHDPSGECADIVKEETVVLEQLEAPVITAEENFGQVTSQYVTMSAQSGAEIYYTTDGSAPSVQNGTKYIMPFTIDSVGTTTVKAVAVKKGTVNSTIATKDVVVRYLVMGITLDHTSAELYTNSTQNNRTITLIPTVTPTQAQGTTLQWKSDNPDVATVDENGIVTAVTPGTTTIRVSADFRTASCEITVKALVESIQITNTTLAVTKDRGTLKLATKVYPDNASDKSLSYKVEPSDRDGEDKGIASITDDGTLTAIKNGVVKVTVTAQDTGKAEQTAYVVLSNQKSYELLYTPKLTQTSFTLNKQSTEGIAFSILPIQENTIDSVQLLSYSDYFALERIEGTENDWQIKFINKQLTPGNYKLAIQITSNDTFNTTINVKVTDASPKVTLKSVTVNLAYPNAEYPLTVTSKSGSVKVLGIEDDKEAGFTENFEVTGGVSSPTKPYEQF